MALRGQRGLSAPSGHPDHAKEVCCNLTGPSVRSRTTPKGRVDVGGMTAPLLDSTPCCAGGVGIVWRCRCGCNAEAGQPRAVVRRSPDFALSRSAARGKVRGMPHRVIRARATSSAGVTVSSSRIRPRAGGRDRRGPPRSAAMPASSADCRRPGCGPQTRAASRCARTRRLLRVGRFRPTGRLTTSSVACAPG
jgi:hypothetical protein